MGQSRPWPDALEAITGQRHMDAAPLLDFFRPLQDWLEIQNKGEDLDWEEECPDGSFTSGASGTWTSISAVVIMAMWALLHQMK